MIQKNLKNMQKKKYYVTICEEVPGMIYEMSTIIPSENSDEPLMKETLIFDKTLN